MEAQIYPKSALYHEIKALIDEQVGEVGREYTIGKFTGDGWLNFHYVCSTYDGQYPRISLKQQKQSVNFYLMLWIDGKPVLENYQSVFGKTALGKGCLRLKKIDDKGKVALKEIIALALEKHRVDYE